MVGSQRGGIAFEECRACRGAFLGRVDMERLLVRGSGGPMVNGLPYEGRHRRD
jgi:Zn-finger nucleic acid-binding protein